MTAITGALPLTLALVLLTGCVWYFGRRRNALPLPPGPKGLPVMGNVFHVPKKEPYTTYMGWAKQFSEFDIRVLRMSPAELQLQIQTSSRFGSFRRRSSSSALQTSSVPCWTSGPTRIRTDLYPQWTSCEWVKFKARRVHFMVKTGAA